MSDPSLEDRQIFVEFMSSWHFTDITKKFVMLTPYTSTPALDIDKMGFISITCVSTITGNPTEFYLTDSGKKIIQDVIDFKKL